MAEPAPPFAALRVLEAACRLQSYSLTGEELGVTTARSARRCAG